MGETIFLPCSFCLIFSSKYPEVRFVGVNQSTRQFPKCIHHTTWFDHATVGWNIQHHLLGSPPPMLSNWFASLKSNLFSIRRFERSSTPSNDDSEFDEMVRILLPSHGHRMITLPPRSCVPSISHMQQQFNWDCGISCLQMAILWLMQSDDDDVLEDRATTKLPSDCTALRTWITQTIATESIWTIDLLFVLQKHLQGCFDTTLKRRDAICCGGRCSYLLLTRSIAIPKDYANVQYYKSKFQEDRQRVTQRLQQVRKHDESIGMSHDSVRQWRHPLAMQQVIHCIQYKNCIAIALIDHTAFTCYGRSDDGSKPKQYIGHYILLTGISYDPSHIQKALSGFHANTVNCSMKPSLELSSNGIATDEFCLVVQDPSHSVQAAPNFVTIQHFEHAWRAYGTDEDILFISRQDYPSNRTQRRE